MTLQRMLDQKNMTKCNLSKISGVPQTTALDLYAGRSSIGRCSAKTVQQLARLGLYDGNAYVAGRTGANEGI